MLYLPIYKLYTMLKSFDILCWKCDQVTYSLVYVGTCAHQRRTDCRMSRQHPRTHHKRVYSQSCRTQDIDRQSFVHRPARMSLQRLSWLSYSTAVHSTNAQYLTEQTERKNDTHFVWWVYNPNSTTTMILLCSESISKMTAYSRVPDRFVNTMIDCVCVIMQ